MPRTRALAGSLIFLLIAPGTAGGLVPWLINHWHFAPPLFGLEWTRWAGAALIALGLVPLIESFVRFALEGRGTPAPVVPTQRLVVGGFYRFVRNPMYVGVVTAIFGQGVFFADGRLFVYAAIVWVFMHLFIVAYEEPRLYHTYGAQYDDFRAHVPRWLPRLKPWNAYSASSSR
ncbi:MAG TPA: isoprenylcysteine carboxylmethyltransferase family protein [Rhizomicrobium sp.]|nr:isoprenylcysteine carboxylmethyltransferase family protein [Rhizomicrobium sp.]